MKAKINVTNHWFLSQNFEDNTLSANIIKGAQERNYHGWISTDN